MPQPIIYKSSLSIAVLTVLRTASPAIVAVAMLYGIIALFEAPFDIRYRVMSVLLVIMAPIVMHQPPLNSTQALAPQGLTAVGLLARWVVLLAILLAIGYATKFSEDFSRRVILTCQQTGGNILPLCFGTKQFEIAWCHELIFTAMK